MSVDVYLHIGLPKTGTTSIQNFFSVNRGELLKEGILYPEAGLRGGAHFELSDALGFKLGIRYQPSYEALRELRDKLDSEVSSCDAIRKLFFSSENFSLFGSVGAVAQFFSGYNVKVVIYLRRHDSWWESKYWQATRMVKNPKWSRGIEGYIEFVKHQKSPGARYINYAKLVDRWSREFGKESIILRPYEAQQMPEGSIPSVLSAIGETSLAISRLAASAQVVNESKSAISLRLLEAFQRIEVSDEIRALLIAHALEVSSDGPKIALISPSLKRDLVEENSADYEYLASRYMSRKCGVLFYDPIPEDDGSWLDPAGLLDLKVTTEIVRALLRIS